MNEYYYMNSYPYYDQMSVYDQRILSPINWFPLPGGGQGGGQGFPFPGGGQSGGNTQQNASAPTTPPPSQIPPKPFTAQGGPSVFLVDPNVIRPCLFRFTYVWLTSGASFWFYPVVLGNNSVGGFYWNSRQFRWMYIGLDTRNIEVVSCS
ncbi:hypothetical protein [Jeotgalibacillus proteolyticus]|uniref:hypothetical protein n=1 Tax=Jeotgalibacillus proteolyticus TaxID=2082395 RepID=UPI003CF0EA22